MTEGTVRYHLKRQAEGSEDGRSKRPYKAEPFAAVIDDWVTDHRARHRSQPVNVTELWEHLVAEFGYGGSYRSVLRYVRGHHPRPKLRIYRRVETPPGAQVQTDWAAYPRVEGTTVTFEEYARPTELQSRALDLLGVSARR